MERRISDQHFVRMTSVDETMGSETASKGLGQSHPPPVIEGGILVLECTTAACKVDCTRLSRKHLAPRTGQIQETWTVETKILLSRSPPPYLHPEVAHHHDHGVVVEVQEGEVLLPQHQDDGVEQLVELGEVVDVGPEEDGARGVGAGWEAHDPREGALERRVRQKAKKTKSEARKYCRVRMSENDSQ